MPNDIYLSSTLTDLQEEREAVRSVLSGRGLGVRESYSADGENNLRDSCVADVQACRLYIGIVGRRYGYCPPNADGTPGTTSITQMEYEAACQYNLPRLIFLKDDKLIYGIHWDKHNGDNDGGDRIERFRDNLGSGKEVRPEMFSTTAQLREKVLSAVLTHLNQGKVSSIFEPDDPHACELTTNLAVVVDAIGNTDEDHALHKAVQQVAANGLRAQVVPVDPGLPDYLDRLDKAIAKAHGVAWLLSSRSLPLLRERESLIARALNNQRHRRGAVGLVTSGSAIDAPRPASWSLASVSEGDEGLAVALTACFKALRASLPGLAHERCASLPVIVAAMTSAEAATLPTVPGPAHHGLQREDWRPFAAEPKTARAFIQSAIHRFNTQDQSGRERWFIRARGLRLVPHWYSLDDLLQPADGSDILIRRVRDQGALVLLDAHSLQHPVLAGAAGKLLRGANVAVVTTAAADANAQQLQTLLADGSPLAVGQLLQRFRDEQDPRCEIALNHPQRLERWLQLVIPELVGLLNGQEAQPDLVRRASDDTLFAPTTP